MTILLTFFFILDGIIKIFYGYRLRHITNWGWLIVSGLLSLGMAAIITMGWPSTAFWVLGLLVGINLVFFGVSLIFLSFGTRKLPE